MLFHSIDFAIFLPIVFTFYWLSKNNLKLQNWLVVVSSYFFYGYWDWRFLSLILISSLIDFFVGIKLSNNDDSKVRKVLLWVSIIFNLGFLCIFKYYNFFLDSFIASFQFFGVEMGIRSLNIILPVGISFYTFQTMSYSIDVYRRKLEPTKDLATFLAYVSFFPQLVAGPIERATNLLPQFYRKRVFEYSEAVDGMRQMLWGFFKKIVIADNCAVHANIIFDNSENLSGSTLVLGAFLFAFQIYGDFSGYSDIAIGTARLFGFNLMRNFNFPYFSRDIAEFWRRWHISLSTWFRDYLYIPLGGSRGGSLEKLRNIFVIFIASGLWHGANWTFIFWGVLNALYFLPILYANKNRDNLEIVARGKFFPTLEEFVRMIITFSLVVIGWIFFRAENLGHAFAYIQRILSGSLFAFPQFAGMNEALTTCILVFCFVLIEWIGREEDYAFKIVSKAKYKFARWSIYLSMLFVIFLFGNFDEAVEFIYFQF